MIKDKQVIYHIGIFIFILILSLILFSNRNSEIVQNNNIPEIKNIFLQKNLEIPKNIDNIHINFPINNHTNQVIDYTPYINSKLFQGKVANAYYTSDNRITFIKSIWKYIKDNFSYQEDSIDSVQFPETTLKLMKGDCEDLSILIASILLNVPEEWRIYLVYMDINNPYQIQEINHIIVYVNTKYERVYIDPTHPKEMNPYTKQIDGLYLEIKKENINI